MPRVTLAACAAGIAALLLAFLFIPSTPQDPRYHDFADQRTMLGIPNALNVLSNIGFVIVGVLGLLKVRRRDAITLTFFAGMLATGIGSSIYHLSPRDATLVVDRLPMTIAFASFFLLLLDIRSVRALLLMCALGIATIIWWLTLDDLRPYAVFQALPILAFIVTRFFRSGRGPQWPLWFVTAGYIAAKLCETWDRPIYAAFDEIVSGHTLKHVVAALATLAVWIWLYDEARMMPGADVKSSPEWLTTT
ncbi:MAG: hypothetical protein QOI24_3270 [Acidobacteriota bacterium]|jgi:hypothetical protein|nr:hypothetical protein [Acidobacteriota bacterium]